MAISKRMQLIIDRLMEDKDPEGALKLLLSYYDDHINQSVAIYGYWTSIRQAICSDERYRNKFYHQRLSALMERASQEDYDRMLQLYNAPLKAQHRISIQRKPYLQDRQLDKDMKEIKPIKIFLYQFVLPHEIVADSLHQHDLSTIEAQSHQRRSFESYHMSEEEANDMIETSIAVLHDNIATDKDYFKNMVALQIVCGRRNYEIMSSLNYREASHPYQVTVSGILKKKILKERDNTEYTIPLLCTYDLFKRAMDRFRDSKDVFGTPSEVNSTMGTKLMTASNKMFGRRLTHTQKRNIYVEMAWKRRHSENNYLINDQSCSKPMWTVHALAQEAHFGVHDSYQTMIIE